ncbi:response regulator [Undibacterium sp. Ji22W]|uniref:response regulator n=1 Tax=Undibacterium sp. Ji22W TaxID=3413038 RepID=UPI003BF03BA3
MSTIRILAIDDDEMVLNYLQRMLGNHYQLILCAEPQVAHVIAKAELPDLILCDIDMPEMDGGAVLAALAADVHTATIPFVYLTAMVSPSEVQALDGIVGGRPGISKRANLAEMIAAIEANLPRA